MTKCVFLQKRLTMEGMKRTPESDRIQLAVIAIETASKKMGISTNELTERLEHQGIIDNHILKYYDTLHTQSADYVADDVIETLKNYEADE